jgi:extracellular elastinolytic metalloproteinase
MQMYLFRNGTLSDGSPSPFRDVNGGDDASVVYHEYTHGLSSRLVIDADGAGALNSAQSGAMGEAWSDFYAKDYLNTEGLQPDTAAPGEVDMGIYVDATPHQIRNQGLDCPVGSSSPACPGTPTAGPGGFTYGDFGRVVDGPEVHNDGEIWAETLWDLRARTSPAISEEIVTEGMRLSPPEPSFLDMRNAIIQADIAVRGGAEVDAIWAAFAARGMGFFAGTEDGSDTAPVENFDPPPAAGGPTGTISGRVTDSVTGAPLGGIVVGIGGLETAPSSFVATTNANGVYSIGPVPVGTYPILVFRPGAGYERFSARTVEVGDGATVTVNARSAAAPTGPSTSATGPDGRRTTPRRPASPASRRTRTAARRRPRRSGCRWR